MPDALKRIHSALLLAMLRRRALLWLAFAAPWVVLQTWSAFLPLMLVVVVDGWRWHRHLQQHFTSWMNAYCVELEDSSELLWHAETPIARLQQSRLAARLETVLDATRIQQIARSVLSLHYLWRAALIVNLCLAACLGYQSKIMSGMPSVVESASSPTPAALAHLMLRITPPAYTGLAAFDSEAKELSVPEHSQISWCLQSNTGIAPDLAGQEIRLSDGQHLSFLQGTPSKDQQQICVSWDATESVFWTWSGDAKQQRWNLKVKLDQAPQVEIQKPSEMLQVLSPEHKQFAMAVRVTDDYRIVNASLHLTLARGSGENVRFSDKEVILPQGTDARSRQWQKQWTLGELGMEAGDELYFFVRATDNSLPTPHITTSPTYTVRLPAPDAKEEQTSVLPILVKPESLRSQRQIIIDTEQLVADIKANTKLSPALIRSRSETIANDQAALRRRYGKFLGEESTLFGEEAEGEHGEHDGHAEHHGEKQSKDEYKPVDMAAAYGHAHDQEENATLFDEATKKILRKVLAAMWDAEKSLRALTPATALSPENKALEGIKQLQQADRIYLHKAAFVPPVIKEEKRLTGDVLEAKNWKSQQIKTGDRIPPEIRDLIRDMSQSNALPALWSKTARTWFAQNLKDEEQRLAAQAAVQDVIDGCDSCRPSLRAWLRLSLGEGNILLQAREAGDSSGKLTTKSRLQQAWKDAGLQQDAASGVRR